jgi:hypothetical protein
VKPYTAIYKLTLKNKTLRSLTESLSGELHVELQDVGEGWTFQQKGSCILHQPDSEEGNQTLAWIYTIWEAKNGRHLRFLWKRWLSESLDEDSQGEVIYDPQTQQGRILTFNPINTLQPVHGPLLFPIAHLNKMLKIAEKSQPDTLSEIVFDGAGGASPSRLNTFIALPHSLEITSVHKSGPKASPHLAKKIFKIWPVFTAAYHPQNMLELPEDTASSMITKAGLPVTFTIPIGEVEALATLVLPEALSPKFQKLADPPKKAKPRSSKQKNSGGSLSASASPPMLILID